MHRRSVRKYSAARVEEEKIAALAKAALLGPCSRSNKTWTIIIIQKEDTILKLSKCRPSSSGFLANAPLVFALISDPTVDTWIEDASIAATLIQITAVSLGLGTCWCQIRNRTYSSSKTSEQYVREILEIPDDYCVECLIGIGYPGEAILPYNEKELPYYKICCENIK